MKFHGGRVVLHHGDCREALRGLEDNSVDSVVTDAPYHLTTGKRGGTGDASINLKSPAGRSRAPRDWTPTSDEGKTRAWAPAT